MLSRRIYGKSGIIIAKGGIIRSIIRTKNQKTSKKNI